MKKITTQLDTDLTNLITEYTKEHKTTYSKTVRRALYFYLNRDKPQQYGNQEITSMLERIKIKLQVTDFKENKKFQRIYGKHLVGLYKKLGRANFADRFNTLIEDDFNRKHCGSLKFLYSKIKSIVPDQTFVKVGKKQIPRSSLGALLASGEVYLNQYSNQYEYRIN